MTGAFIQFLFHLSVFTEELVALFHNDDDANNSEQIFHAAVPYGCLTQAVRNGVNPLSC